MRKEKSRSPPKLSNGRLPLILACLPTTCKNTDSQRLSYCDVGTSVISEFYTPLVPKGHDFLQTIGFLAQARQDGTATCEAKGDGSD